MIRIELVKGGIVDVAGCLRPPLLMVESVKAGREAAAGDVILNIPPRICRGCSNPEIQDSTPKSTASAAIHKLTSVGVYAEHKGNLKRQ